MQQSVAKEAKFLSDPTAASRLKSSQSLAVNKEETVHESIVAK